MNAEILTITPVSGVFPEQHFGSHFNSKLWVKVVDTRFDDWVGCFSKSYDHGLCQVLVSHDNSIGFVIAGGHGYLVDINERTIVKELDGPLIESAR